MMMQQTLLDEAQAILRRLDLLSLMGRFGEARVVGSVALDLIVKRDIDVHLLTAAPDLLAVADAVYHPLLERAEIEEVRISDTRPGGVKVGIDHYPGPSGIWSLDLWITDRPEATGFALAERLACELRDEHRQAILAIKRDCDRRGLLEDGLSTAIYLAVLDGGVRTAEAFAACRVAREETLPGSVE